MPKALMRTNLTQGTYVGSYVKKTPNVIGPNLMHPFVESPPHDGFQEHTHSFLTPGYCSQEIFSEVSSSTLNASTTAEKQENLVNAFKRLVDNQEGFSGLSPNSPEG